MKADASRHLAFKQFAGTTNTRPSRYNICKRYDKYVRHSNIPLRQAQQNGDPSILPAYAAQSDGLMESSQPPVNSILYAVSQRAIADTHDSTAEAHAARRQNVGHGDLKEM